LYRVRFDELSGELSATGKRHREHTARVFDRPDVYLAAMQLDELTHQRQAKPEAAVAAAR
jgi:hypothetical protein